jgi:hypothetical protein
MAVQPDFGYSWIKGENDSSTSQVSGVHVRKKAEHVPKEKATTPTL